MKAWIREDLIPKFLKNADKLISKANKINAEPITVTPTGKTKLREKKPNFDSEVEAGVSLSTEQHRAYFGIPYVEMEIDGVMPVVEGWEFFAKINHMGKDEDSGQFLNVVETSPFIHQQSDFEASIQSHQACPPNCQHCDTVRNRSTTFLLRNIESKEIKQVGSTCIDDFLNTDSLSKALFHFNINKFFLELDNYAFEGGNYHYRIEPVIALACYFVKEYGFARTSDEAPTKQRVINQLRATCGSLDAEAIKIIHDYERGIENPYLNDANEVIEATLAAESDNTYIHNAKSIIKVGYIDIFSGSTLGIAVSLPKDFYVNKAKEGITFKEEFFGSEKDRGILKLKLLEKNDSYDTDYPYTSYRFIDDNGIRFSAKSYFKSYIDLDVGKTYTMKATVKGHYTHDDGRKSTNITRIADLEEVTADIPTPEFKAPKKPRAKKTAECTLSM